MECISAREFPMQHIECSILKHCICIIYVRCRIGDVDGLCAAILTICIDMSPIGVTIQKVQRIEGDAS
jgi:hypothetical protein